MGDHTSIEWVRALAAARNAIPATWNPIDGCSRESEGCRFCWAADLVHKRLSKSLPGRYAGLTELDGHGVARFNGRVRLAAHVLDRPLKASRPRVYFTGDMADLFHPSVPSEWLDRIFVAIAAGQQHTHLLLTKRPSVMRAYITDPGTPARIDAALDQYLPAHWHARELEDFGGWPLPNVWLGATVTSQKDAVANVPELLETPAAKRFLSLEPLLGPVDLHRIDVEDGICDALGGNAAVEGRGTAKCDHLDWIITGGEAAANARPSHPDWFRSLRDQSAAAGVPFLFKQHGDWIDERMATAQGCAPGPGMFGPDGMPKSDRWHFYDGQDRIGGAAIRIGKKAAGRLLDGVLHDAVPLAVPR